MMTAVATNTTRDVTQLSELQQQLLYEGDILLQVTELHTKTFIEPAFQHTLSINHCGYIRNAAHPMRGAESV